MYLLGQDKMGSSYFHNDTFVISQYNFKVEIRLTTYYTSAINISKVLNFGIKFRCWFARFRSSRPEVFCRKGTFRNFQKFTGKHLCQSLFLNKVAGLRHRPFAKNFFFTEHLWAIASEKTDLNHLSTFCI